MSQFLQSLLIQGDRPEITEEQVELERAAMTDAEKIGSSDGYVWKEVYSRQRGRGGKCRSIGLRQ
jgi:uncharacterized protein YciI